jgi:hypothetical protein
MNQLTISQPRDFDALKFRRLNRKEYYAANAAEQISFLRNRCAMSNGLKIVSCFSQVICFSKMEEKTGTFYFGRKRNFLIWRDISTCNDVMNELSLHIRDWTCEKCGIHHDRGRGFLIVELITFLVVVQ